VNPFEDVVPLVRAEPKVDEDEVPRLSPKLLHAVLWRRGEHALRLGAHLVERFYEELAISPIVVDDEYVDSSPFC